LKLLHVICSTDPESGGPIEAILRTAELLLRDGHEVEIVSLESKEEVEQRRFSLPVIGVGSGIGKYRYNSKLTSWLSEHAPSFDAVILNGLWNYSSLGAWRALRNLSTPYFIFTHGMMDPWFRSKYPLKHCVKQFYWTLAEGRVLEDARAVLFTCEEEMLSARGVFLGYTYNECVIPFGTSDPCGDIDKQKESFAKALPKLNGRKSLLYLSRIHPKKGCDLLVEAFAADIADLPADLDLVIAGPDHLGWAKELQALAAKVGIAERVHWPGMLTGDLKWGAFHSAETLILPSHQENFGFAVAEAMACAKPVLISNKVNIWREIVAAGGGLVEPDTLEGTRSLIRSFFSLSKEERARMASGARAGFLRSFNIETNARAFVRTIERLSEEPKNAGSAMREKIVS
jgi:glycosyltransferase involved in cell wall biosynthesis